MIAGRVFGTALVLFTVVTVGRRMLDREGEPAGAAPLAAVPAAEAHQGLLYGRVTTGDGDVYQGRLRWGGDEEALWTNHFNGFKAVNPWASQVPEARLPRERIAIRIFGVELVGWDKTLPLGRPFMVRFGDIARIDPSRREIRVTLRSGAAVVLDRYAADDLADGLRIWDERQGMVDLGERRIRSIEFLPTPPLGDAPQPLHGTVRTPQGEFTGLIQWDREEVLATDVLDGLTGDGSSVSVPFAAIRSIERRPSEGTRVTLLDGTELQLSGTRNAGPENRGVYVDDARYGRVLVSWQAFQRLDLTSGPGAPAYADFPVGRPLTGTVVTRDGGRLTGRLVYDLDESETTETLDAPFQGVDYTIPFALVGTVRLPEPEDGSVHRARITLVGGQEIELERSGDLGDAHGGMLIFPAGADRPEYVPWSEVERIEFAHAG